MKKFFKLILLITFSFSCLWVSGLLWFKESLAEKERTIEDGADAIIVLTGGSDRLERAVELLKERKANELFISGVGEGVLLSEIFSTMEVSQKDSDNLKDYIELGYEAKDTRGNALEVAKWLIEKRYSKIILVTSNYHMARARAEIKKRLSDVEIIDYPVVSENVILDKWFLYQGSRELIISEYNKLIVSSIDLVLGKRRKG